VRHFFSIYEERILLHKDPLESDDPIEKKN